MDMNMHECGREFLLGFDFDLRQRHGHDMHCAPYTLAFMTGQMVRRFFLYFTSLVCWR
jgi:hypothetical protein